MAARTAPVLLLVLLLAAGCAQLGPEPPADPPASPEPVPGSPLVDACEGGAAGPCPITVPIEGLLLDVAVDPLDAGHVVVAMGVDRPETPAEPGGSAYLRHPVLAVTRDGGATWGYIDLPFGQWENPGSTPHGFQTLDDLEVALTTNGTLAVAALERDAYGYMSPVVGVSHDGGATWLKSPPAEDQADDIHLEAAGDRPVLVVREVLFVETVQAWNGKAFRSPRAGFPDCQGISDLQPLANGTLLGVCNTAQPSETLLPFWVHPDGNFTHGPLLRVGECDPLLAAERAPGVLEVAAHCGGESTAILADLQAGSLAVRPLPDLPSPLPVQTHPHPRESVVDAAQEPDGTLRVLVRWEGTAPDTTRLEEVRFGPGFTVLGKRDLSVAGYVHAGVAIAGDTGWLGWGTQERGPLPFIFASSLPTGGTTALQSLGPAPAAMPLQPSESP